MITDTSLTSFNVVSDWSIAESKWFVNIVWNLDQRYLIVLSQDTPGSEKVQTFFWFDDLGGDEIGILADGLQCAMFRTNWSYNDLGPMGQSLTYQPPVELLPAFFGIGTWDINLVWLNGSNFEQEHIVTVESAPSQDQAVGRAMELFYTQFPNQTPDGWYLSTWEVRPRPQTDLTFEQQLDGVQGDFFLETNSPDQPGHMVWVQRCQNPVELQPGQRYNLADVNDYYWVGVDYRFPTWTQLVLGTNRPQKRMVHKKAIVWAMSRVQSDPAKWTLGQPL